MAFADPGVTGVYSARFVDLYAGPIRTILFDPLIGVGKGDAEHGK